MCLLHSYAELPHSKSFFVWDLAVHDSDLADISGRPLCKGLGYFLFVQQYRLNLSGHHKHIQEKQQMRLL